MKAEYNNILGMIDEKYIIIAKIDESNFSIVYKVQNVESKVYLAAKVIKPLHFSRNELNNNRALSKINSPYIIKFISFEQGKIKLSDEEAEDATPFFTFELADKGNLFDYISCGKGGFKELHCKFIFYEILLGFQAIHNEDICHRDIKAENILISSDRYSIKICDLGFSADSTELQTGSCGTRNYKAPEVIMDRNEYDGIKADIFSLGVLLFFLGTSKFNFEQAKINNKSRTSYDYVKEKKSDELWKVCKANTIGLTEEFKELYLKMIAYEPKERPSIDEIINGEWMKDIRGLSENQYESLRKDVIKEFKEREEIILSNKGLRV